MEEWEGESILHGALLRVATLVAVLGLMSCAGTETQTCSASGNDPGKVCFGPSTSSANISAGWHLNSSAPVYVMYEAATSEDEHNLSGTQ